MKLDNWTIDIKEEHSANKRSKLINKRSIRMNLVKTFSREAPVLTDTSDKCFMARMSRKKKGKS